MSVQKESFVKNLSDYCEKKMKKCRWTLKTVTNNNIFLLHEKFFILILRDACSKIRVNRNC